MYWPPGGRLQYRTANYTCNDRITLSSIMGNLKKINISPLIREVMNIVSDFSPVIKHLFLYHLCHDHQLFPPLHIL
jgi:hypothetical protein